MQLNNSGNEVALFSLAYEDAEFGSGVKPVPFLHTGTISESSQHILLPTRGGMKFT